MLNRTFRTLLLLLIYMAGDKTFTENKVKKNAHFIGLHDVTYI